VGVSRTLAALLTAMSAGGCGPYGLVEVTPFGAAAYEPSVAVFRDGLAVAWYDTRSGHGELYQQALDAGGQFDGTEVRLATPAGGDAFEADIHAVEGSSSGDGFVVGWYERNTDRTHVARLGLWSRTGATRWTRTISERGRNTVAGVTGDLVFAAWIEDEVDPGAGVWSGWWNLRGDTVVAPRRIADAGKTTYNLNAALVDRAPGRGVPTALVVFDAVVRTTASELYAAEDDGVSARVVRLTPDDGFPSTYPDLALSDSRVALTWFDAKDGNEEVYLRVTTRPGLARGAEAADRRVTNTKGHSIGAYAAWNGNRLGLAWCDDTPGQYEIYFAEFDAAGSPRGEARQLTVTRAGSLIPSIHAWRGGFVLAWNEYEGATAHDAEGRSQVLLRMIE
jgi:hypothetical protein